MARPRLYSLDKLASGAKEYKSSWSNAVNAARLAIFGHTSRFVGDEEWLKPLQGPNRSRWYWPSKYLHMDFTLRHYLAMQISRFKKKQDDPTIVHLWKTVEKVNSNRDSISSFLKSVDADTFANSTTIQDTYLLYRLIFKESPLSFEPDPKLTSRLENPKYLPFIKYTLKHLESGPNASLRDELDALSRSGEQRKEKLRTGLRALVQNDPSLASVFRTRHRFVDLLYLRRRNYYLDKLARRRKISEIKTKYKSHFLTHPDEKRIWPDSRGIHQHKWPSV